MIERQIRAWQGHFALFGLNHRDRVEAALLASAYTESLRQAERVGAESVAFPSISTGVYGYPFEKAALVALQAIRETLPQCPSIRRVILCCFSAQDAEFYCKQPGVVAAEL